MSNLTCEQARLIPIIEYLKHLGFNPQNSKGYNHWYISPFRNEKHASFKINSLRNIWYDFGEGCGGNLIDLGTRLHQCSVSDLLQMLSGSNYTPVLIPVDRAALNKQEEESKVKIIGAYDLVDQSLLAYLKSRGINLNIAKKYCQQADFTIYRKKYTAISFANKSGGYELRSSLIKVSSSPKDFTLIDNGSKNLKSVEGYMDFLSLLTMHPKDHADFNYLILNSVNMLSRALDIMGDYKNIFAYYDQNSAGRKATELVMNTFKNAVDASVFYPKFEDVNDYWVDQLSRGKPR
ncbi:toprim domain-containing protein [Pedobacter frigoris]|uniref:DNA primase n=1 Tax=Pedobacter frigoris TaxID=2571272 RepID=A0A4U1CKG9_9SPHI|nr:toprim domain-containing protein [Pedobacter frigoris]TKC07509.1 DNA primase [Pedobacter frigoris]